METWTGFTFSLEGPDFLEVLRCFKNCLAWIVLKSYELIMDCLTILDTLGLLNDSFSQIGNCSGWLGIIQQWLFQWQFMAFFWQFSGFFGFFQSTWISWIKKKFSPWIHLISSQKKRANYRYFFYFSKMTPRRFPWTFLQSWRSFNIYLFLSYFSVLLENFFENLWDPLRFFNIVQIGSINDLQGL